MRLLQLIVASTCFSVIVRADDTLGQTIWPAATVGERYTQQETTLRVLTLREWTVKYSSGKHHGSLRDATVKETLREAMKRFVKVLEGMIPSNAHELPVNPHHKILLPLKKIQIHVEVPSKKTLVSEMEESYSLEIPSKQDRDAVILSAKSVVGVLRGLQTLWQLVHFGWYDDGGHYANYIIPHCPIRIDDTPTYSYRGLLVDTSRHFLPVDFLLRQLDVMEWNKLNILHWHLTDSPSWPYQSEAFPELSAKGAFCKSCVYTPDDIRRIQKEATLRGIRVIVEVDMPGHISAIGQSHPELLTACHRADGVCEPLNVTSKAVSDFVDVLMREITALWTDPWIHIGGDEVNTGHWNKSAQIHKWMNQHGMESVNELQPYFEAKLLDLLTRQLHRRPIAWQEVFDLRGGTAIPKETIVDVWKVAYSDHPDSRIEATLQGHDVVLSSCWYLDHLQQDWKTFYKCDPRGFDGTSEQKAHVLGGHASMWGEHVDETNFVQRVWPRASAVAEKLWTGNQTAATMSSDKRLHTFRCRMVQQGVQAAPSQSGSYCGDDVNVEVVAPAAAKLEEDASLVGIA